MRILDLYCGAGSASYGYARDGFEILGVDNEPQKRYPFTLYAQDPLRYARGFGADFDAIHAHVDGSNAMEVRNTLLQIGRPYILEASKGDHLLNPTLLCGDMFALGCWFEGEFLRLRRHRYYETTFDVEQVRHMKHVGPTLSIGGRPGGSSKRDGRKFPPVAGWKEAMGIDWMVAAELSKANPPVYTEFLGSELFKSLRG